MSLFIAVTCSRGKPDDCTNQFPLDEVAGVTADGIRNASEYIAILYEEAKNKGWRRFNGEGWVCPGCSTETK